ncbi:MAG TPA: response regulator [Myxococcota bacterium]|nr:response regulator [Myxococcota bacterium]
MAQPLILVVEDRPMNAKLLRDVLGASGYDVVEAVDAETGLALAREREPALVLMDIQLPGMDGVTAVGELKKDPRTAKIPVIAVTASAMPLEREAILRAGFDGYQAKPISVKELLGEVRRLVRAEG